MKKRFFKDGKPIVKELTEKEIASFEAEQKELQIEVKKNTIFEQLNQLDLILPRSVEDLYDGKLTISPKGRTLEAYNRKKELRAELAAL